MTRAEKAAFWRRHVESLQQSGLSIRAYAERAGVAVSGLKYWCKHMSQARWGNAPLMLDADTFLYEAHYYRQLAETPKAA